MKLKSAKELRTQRCDVIMGIQMKCLVSNAYFLSISCKNSVLICLKMQNLLSKILKSPRARYLRQHAVGCDSMTDYRSAIPCVQYF